MKRPILVIVGLLILSFAVWLSVVTPYQLKERADVNRHVFDVIKSRSNWDTQKPLLYGFFFTSDHKASLAILGFLLELAGHRVVQISKDEEKEYFWLHVERIQVHDLDSISSKDIRLGRIGAICMSEYDGWDVGTDLTPTKTKNRPNGAIDRITMPSALLSCLLLFPLRGQESRQKQVVIGHRGRSAKI